MLQQFLLSFFFLLFLKLFFKIYLAKMRESFKVRINSYLKASYIFFLFVWIENGDEEGGNSNLPIIVGISCGSFVVLALLAIFALFRCKRPGRRPMKTEISDGLPVDVDFSKAESYELRHEITCHNEQGQWNEGME